MDDRELKRAMLALLLIVSFMSVLGTRVLQSSAGEPVEASASTDPLDTRVDLTFTVNPNGRVAVKGAIKDNTTTIQPANWPASTLYGSLSLTEGGAVKNITILVPPENATEFPFNSTTLSLLETYGEGILYEGLNFTLVFPENLSKFDLLIPAEFSPYTYIFENLLNSTEFTLDEQYSDGDIIQSVHCTMTADLTDLLQKILPIPLGFEAPLHLSLNYSKGEYNGSITLHLLPGLPMADVNVDVTGNLTSVWFNGTVTVVYGNYFGMTIDEALLEFVKYYAETVFNASIDTEGSLLNMTKGMCECPYVSVKLENIISNGAVIGSEVTFKVCIRGQMYMPFLLYPLQSGTLQETPLEMLWLFFKSNDMLYKQQNATLDLWYTPSDTRLDFTFNGTIHVRDLVEQLLEPVVVPEKWLEVAEEYGLELPPIINSTNLPRAWAAVSMLNATIYSFENASLHMAYTCDDRKLAVSFTKYLADPEGLSESLLEMLSEFPPESLELPELQLPPNMTELIDSLLAERLVNVTTGENRLTYADGTLTLIEAEAFEGDLNAELNYLKGVLMINYYVKGVDYLNETATPLPWQLSYLNETEIDAIGMKVNLKADNTSIEARAEGIAVQPSVDPINATAFKLDRFFNLTGPEFPGENEQLSVTVVGGSNATHKVTLYNATGVPEPDLVLLDAENRATLMAWNNVTLTDLRELQFITVAGAQAGDIITDPETVTPENPLIIDATETLGVAINVTGVSDTVAIVVSNVTEPEGVKPPPGMWKLLGNYVQITVSNETVAVNATIRIHYTDAQVAEAGLDESTLTIHYWNATLGEWVAVEPSYVNTEENYVWANINHFSIFTLMGQTPPTPFWMHWWFIATIVVVVVIAAAAGVLASRRRAATATATAT